MKKLNAFQLLLNCSSHVLKLAFSFVFLLSMSSNVLANTCQMNCNQNVQVSLDENCEARITYDVMLEDPDNPALCSPNGPSAYVVTVMDHWGNPIGDHLTKENLVDGYCGVTYLVKVKHWASGNICWGSIIVEDKLQPYGYLPDVELPCTSPLPAYWSLDKLSKHVYDNCGPLYLVDRTTTTVATNCDYYNISAQFKRTYTIADECGNTVVLTHYITLRPQSIVKPADYYTTCKDPDISPASAGWPTIGGLPLMGGGDKVGYCEWAVDYVDHVVDICLESGSKSVVRTWKCTYICTGDVFKYDQKIFVRDLDPWVDPPANESLWLGTNVPGYNCAYYGPLPAPRVTDICSSVASIRATVYYGIETSYNHEQPVVTDLNILAGEPIYLQNGPFVVKYTVSDVCHGHTNIYAYGAVYDNTPPVAIADTETTVDLVPNSDPVFGECTTALYAKNLDSGTYDNCKLEAIYVRRMNADGSDFAPGSSWGPYVTFGIDDACATHMVAFRAYDSDKVGPKDEALWSQVMVNVEVQDNFIALQNLNDKEIACSGDDDWNAEDAFDTPAVYGCTAEIYDIQTTSNILNCGRSTYTRTWYARNCKGIETSTSQTIYIYYQGTIDFTCPADVDFDCGQGYTADSFTEDVTGRPSVTTTGCAVAAVSEPYDEVFRHEGEGDGCFKIKRSWNIIDWCNGGIYVGSCHQLITVTDKDQPIVTADDVDVCITDGCDATFAVPGPNIDDCTATTTEVYWEFTAKDGAVSAGFVSVGQLVTFGPGVLELKYIVKDACGNFGNGFATVTITDCKNPTPFCRNPIATPIMNTTGDIEIWASDFLLKAEDNCTSAAMVEESVVMRLTGSTDAPSKNLRLTCADLSFSGGFAGVQVDIIVYDMAGNSDFCTVSFVIQDNESTCSASAAGGDVASIITDFNSEEGESVQNVKVNLKSSDMNLSEVTTPSGVAQFSNLPMHYDYEVSGEKSDNLLNGVSTYDVVKLTRHILGIDKLNSPYKLIAADVNNSGSISTGDVLALRRAILAITDEFTNNTSWRFVEASYLFPDPTNPWIEEFPEALNISDLDHDMQAEFIGIKIGDLNGNAAPNELLGSSSFTGKDLIVGLDDIDMKAGEQYEITFKSKDFNHFGYQFTLGFDQDAIEVNDVTPGALEGLSHNNFGMQLLDQGAITTIWDNANGTQLDDNNALFTLSVSAKTDTRLSNVFNINSTVTAAEAVNSELEATGVTLEFFNNKAAQFELFQNTPNPFKGETLIEFALPTSDQVSFKVFDVAGKVLYQRVQNLDRGTHQIRISKADLNATGVLYYQVETSTDVATKKMISVE